MQNRLNVVLLFLVPILGLNSCSKKTDEWKMSEPVIESASAEPLTVTAATRRSLNGGSVIRFRGPAWSTLATTSICTFEGKEFRSSFTLSYQPTLKVRSLWPSSLWKSFSTKQLAHSECDFEFVAENEAGSTHRFSFSRIKLSSFETLDEADVALDVKSLEARVKTLTDHLGDESNVSLVCGANQAEIPLRAASRGASTTQALMEKINLRGPHDCHFLAWDPVQVPVQYEISAERTIRFAAVPLKMNVVFPLADSNPKISRLNFGGQTLVTFSIENPTSEKAFVRLPGFESVVFRLVARLEGRLFNPELRENDLFQGLDVRTPIRVSLDGASLAPAAVIEIPGGETKNISVVFDRTQRLDQCLQPNPNATVDTPSMAIGFKFDFSGGFSIEQIDSPESSDSTVLYSAPTASAERLTQSVVFKHAVAEFGNSLVGLQVRKFEVGHDLCF